MFDKKCFGEMIGTLITHYLAKGKITQKEMLESLSEHSVSLQYAIEEREDRAREVAQELQEPDCECGSCSCGDTCEELCSGDANLFDDSMDGDHASALASAGWGTDEDYGGGMEHL